jgi:hypothetical protein
MQDQQKKKTRRPPRREKPETLIGDALDFLF